MEGGRPLPAKEWATSIHTFNKYLLCAKHRSRYWEHGGEDRKDTFSALMKITFQSGEIGTRYFRVRAIVGLHGRRACVDGGNRVSLQGVRKAFQGKGALS